MKDTEYIRMLSGGKEPNEEQKVRLLAAGWECMFAVLTGKNWEDISRKEREESAKIFKECMIKIVELFDSNKGKRDGGIEEWISKLG